MGNKRKYPTVSGWWLYTIFVPSIQKYYVGVSGCKKCCQRWSKSRYNGTALSQYLSEWDSMEKTVIQDNLTKEEVLKKEDELIQELNKKGLCINEQRSGLIYASDKNAYHKQYYQNDAEYREQQKQLSRQWRLKNTEYSKQRYANNTEYREQQKQRAKQNRLKKKLQQQTVVL